MTRNPFGSIFGKVIEPKKLKSEKVIEKSAQTESASASVSSSIEADKKNPFEHTTKQFKATTGLEIKDPRVLLETAKFDKNQKELEYKNTAQDIENLKKKIANTQMYLGLLSTYSDLSKAGQNEISEWVSNNSSIIKNIVDARNLQKLANKTEKKNEVLDIKINHLKDLIQLKNSGAEIIGTDALRYFQPTSPVVKADPPAAGKVPEIEGKIPIKQLYTVYKLGDVDDSYFQKFKQGLPSKDSYFEAHKKQYEKSQLGKDIEKTVLLSKQMAWKNNELLSEKNKLIKQYNELQQQTKDYLEIINSKIPGSTAVTTAIGVLADLKPEKFQKMNIIGGLKASALEVSQLGDEETPSISDTKDLLEIASMDVQLATQQQKEKENTISILESKITGKPPIIQTLTPPPIKEEKATLQTITKLLPWVVGAIIIYKVMG